MSTQPYQGIYPIAPVAFHPNGDLDREGNTRVIECMIDQGVDGICILANYSEQFLLSDEEREEILELSMKTVAGRVPVIVTCSHFATRIAAARAKRAAAAGAKMIMLMPPYHGAALRGGELGPAIVPGQPRESVLISVAPAIPGIFNNARWADSLPGFKRFTCRRPSCWPANCGNRPRS